MAFSVGTRVALRVDHHGLAKGMPGKVVGTGFTGGNDVRFDHGVTLNGIRDDQLVELADASNNGGCAVTAMTLGAGITAAAATVAGWRFGG